MKQFISYCRVSTQKQGLGIEAQKAIIESYAKNNDGTIIATFEEKESGKDTIHREGLQSAIKVARATGAVLLVAKLDRLSRDIIDIFTLKKDKSFTFDVCDIDAADTLTLGIFATLAQKERELISRRTREALQELKSKGKKLGNPNAADTLRQYNAKGVQVRKEAANNSTANRHAYAAIRFVQGSLQKKADYLNENGYTTRTGKAFAPMSVKRLIDRYENQ